MVKQLALLFLAAAVAVGATSCKKAAQDPAAAQLAKFKAEQKAKALKSYQDLVKKYPDSPYAEKAKERIRVLTPPATPAKK